MEAWSDVVVPQGKPKLSSSLLLKQVKPLRSYCGMPVKVAFP